ncbi:metal-dependent transcriptional regulator [Marispirochaeta aestuarii]|uniref:metal-dependent transcriptional regulator n=1 Tax=Marispirochaeta aestuarii TaxID=1963862 RepID=UPI002ABD9450|nr:metal-dependent transcriptional regulator [Marispirochaeta aestuarii]
MVEKLTQSLEDYLEAILFLEKKNRVARVKDIAEALKVQMPSVTGAVRILKEKGLVDYEKNSYITLTNSGAKIARSIYNKHQIVQRFLSEVLMVKEDEAESIACQIEHAMPGSIAARLESFTDFVLSDKVPLGQFRDETGDY